MSEAVIQAEGLGKKYLITHERTGQYQTLRDAISGAANELLSKKKKRQTKEEFWALKDLSFTIQKGEATGIIGRNGAGKSTLLKILSRITDPTEGRILLTGRVASLLEVGTGFHPELTGRENIFLNGAVLGMSRSEIKRKFDEIVDFSGVEKFLDTAVKRYSSGMYVRLAFAVAAHLETEIMMVDEVLAVGDAEFQKKCFEKINQVNEKEGRTVLFVSHNIPAIRQLCKKGILLEDSRICANGMIDDVIHRYSELIGIESSLKAKHKRLNSGAEILGYRFSTEGDEILSGGRILMGKCLDIELEIITSKQIDALSVTIDIRNNQGELLSQMINEDGGYRFPKSEAELVTKVRIRTSHLLYVPGYYTVDLKLGNYHNEEFYSVTNALFVLIEQSKLVGRSTPLSASSKIYLSSKWE